MGATYFFLLSSLGLAITTQAQDCSRPVGGDNMNLKDEFILLNTFQDGDKVSFACNVGYMSAGGSPSITCTAGSWSPLRLKCEKRNCGAAEEVPNGYVDYPKGTQFGDELVVTCNTGYRLVGKNNKRHCGTQGWMGRMPECEVVTCDPPPSVKNGTFRPDKEIYQYGEVVQYTCQRDYTLSGSRTISCSADERFEPAPPTCVMVQCNDPVIPNAEWIGGSRPPHRHQSTVTYMCKPGYTMIGESTQTCGIDGQWSPGLPTCQLLLPTPKATTTTTTKRPSTKKPSVVQCNDPVIPNAEWIGGSRPPHRHQSKVTYMCKPGYTMIGESTQTCGIDGQWSPGLPTCQPGPDPTAPPGNNGRNLALGFGIGLPLCILALCITGWYFCGFPKFIKKKRGSRSSIPDNVVAKHGEDIAL